VLVSSVIAEFVAVVAVVAVVAFPDSAPVNVVAVTAANTTTTMRKIWSRAPLESCLVACKTLK
jgi:hypothetical protein